MLLGAATEPKLGIKAERQSLESISRLLQASGQEDFNRAFTSWLQTMNSVTRAFDEM
jgi:hypothetical protein